MRPVTVKKLLGFRPGQRWSFEKDFQVLRYQMACAAIYGDEERSKRLSEAKECMKKWNYVGRRCAACGAPITRQSGTGFCRVHSQSQKRKAKTPPTPTLTQ